MSSASHTIHTPSGESQWIPELPGYFTMLSPDWVCEIFKKRIRMKLSKAIFFLEVIFIIFTNLNFKTPLRLDKFKFQKILFPPNKKIMQWLLC
jgi:hypothetical protein